MDLFHTERKPKKAPVRMFHRLTYGFSVTTKKTSELVATEKQYPVNTVMLSTAKRPSEERLIHSDYIRALTAKVKDLVIKEHFDNNIDPKLFDHQYMISIDLQSTTRVDSPVLSMLPHLQKRAQTLDTSPQVALA